MHNFDPDNHFWDEFQWESHMRKMEQQADQLRRFIEQPAENNDPRWLQLLKELDSEQDALDAYIEEELMYEEAYFPDDEDDWDDDFDDDDDFFLSGEEDLDDLEEWMDAIWDEEFPDEDFIDDQEGEEWKALSDEYAMSDHGDLENLKIYSDSRAFAMQILKIGPLRNEKALTKLFQQFITDAIDISTKLAAGFGFGFDQDMLGGNIAYCKRALASANRALDVLQEIKKTRVLSLSEYHKLHATLFEIRNDVGVYIQELREQFYRL